MSPPCWLLPHADPVGPWLRARSLVAHLPGNRLPLLIFRAEPSPAVRGELGDLGISYLSLGKKGLNALAAAWKLRALLRAYRAPRVHVWDLADLPIAVVAVPSDTRVCCEIAEGQVPPRFFYWWKKGLDRVHRWYRRGVVPWLDHQKALEVSAWAGEPPADRPKQTDGASEAHVLLVADSPRAVREGLWAYDIFRHAWPAARMSVLASSSTLETGRGFARTLGLASAIDSLDNWPKLDSKNPFCAVSVLGSGPWAGDAALRALSFGVPVLAEDHAAVRGSIARGAPLLAVGPGDRAGLAAALQKIQLGAMDSPPEPFIIPRHFSPETDLAVYTEALD